MPINPNDITTIRVGQLPIGDIALDSILPVENDTILEQITGQQLVNFVNTNANAFQFEIKDLWVSQAYIDDNFDETGLGVDLMLGYAICNGQNGTPNLDGLVSIGYGVNYPVIKAVGGSKNAVVVEHQHLMFAPNNGGQTNIDITSIDYVARRGSAGGDNDYRLVKPTDGSQATVGLSGLTGVNGNNKNMQPYMVLLKIMKL
jgi:hypothetical protein